MPTPTAPLPSAAEKWRARSSYLRWLDALLAWAGLLGILVVVLPGQSGETAAVIAAAAVLLGALVRPLRTSWRPLSAWIGLVVSRPLRPGDRAWFVRDGRVDPVLVTARRGLRLAIAGRSIGEVETITVRRTRVFLVPLTK